MHITFDNENTDLEEKREKVLSEVNSDISYRRFKRVLLFINSHTNPEGLIYHTVHGATDFDEVSSMIPFVNSPS